MFKSAEDSLNVSPESVLLTSVSHVTEKGEVFVHVHNDSYKHFKALYKIIQGHSWKLNNSLPPLIIDTSKLYFTKKFDQITWHRARIVDCHLKKFFSSQICPLAPGEVSVFLIDHGATIKVDVKDLVPMYNMPLILEEFPAQVIFFII